MEKVNDGRTDLHLLEKELEKKSGGKKGVNEILGKPMELDTDIISDRQS